jgi:hypothetical protein
MLLNTKAKLLGPKGLIAEGTVAINSCPGPDGDIVWFSVSWGEGHHWDAYFGNPTNTRFFVRSVKSIDDYEEWNWINFQDAWAEIQSFIAQNLTKD